MSTNTNNLPTLDQATADLEAARTKLIETRAAVVAGDSKVGPGDIADARADVEFAELRVELAADAASHRVDQARVTRIEELVDSITVGDLAEKGREVVDLEAKAVAAIEALYLAAADYRSEMTATRVELQRLGPLPGHVDANDPNSMVVSGTRLHGCTVSFVDGVLRGALHRALSPHLPELRHNEHELLQSATRGLLGVLGDKLTRTAQLAEALDKLDASVPVKGDAK